MYVCLCLGVTNETVSGAVAAGALTTHQVAQACGAGSECGRCRRTVRSIIDAMHHTPRTARPRRESRA
ncbi:bacterioferritin-associated ferredoxin [Mycolicibacterium hippocampi]|uniref:(2Fe-2S)-binding protein n=1 Tax=Mycolicibacterium hippocampi TaxID=659824 RepID=UPI0035143623